MCTPEENYTSSSDDFLFLVTVCHEHEENRRKRKRQYWVHDIFRARLKEGEFHTLFRRLQQDERKFYQYYRMSSAKFNELYDLIRIPLTKQNTKFRQSIGPLERLTVFLRFVATGTDYQTLSFNFRIGHSTIQKIVTHTSNVIWETLRNTAMPQPTTELLKNCAEKFESIWNFPNCVAAIDGKHITIQAPPKSGSLYFNYKKTFSIVLLAMVDAEYRFVAVDVGAYGKNSDGGIFNDSNMGKCLKNNTFGMPQDRPITENGKPLPYIIVGDEAFPCKNYLMRPYSGRGLSEDKRVFNYRLSRARRVSENAFGILCQKFRLFLNKLQLHPKNADKIVLSTLCLHNFLRYDNVFLNVLDEEKTENEAPIFLNISYVGGKFSTDATKVRDSFKEYFMSSAGAVSWQEDTINAGIL